MSSKRYQAVRDKLSAEQHNDILNCWMSAVNHDGHAWVTWTAVEELIADLFKEELKCGADPGADPDVATEGQNPDATPAPQDTYKQGY